MSLACQTAQKVQVPPASRLSLQAGKTFSSLNGLVRFVELLHMNIIFRIIVITLVQWSLTDTPFSATESIYFRLVMQRRTGSHILVETERLPSIRCGIVYLVSRIQGVYARPVAADTRQARLALLRLHSSYCWVSDKL